MTKTCTTTFGKFKIKMEPNNLFVGGTKYCVNISLTKNETSLYWLSTEEGGCELDGKVIKGGETIKMVDLAFSLLRKYEPNRVIIKLLDDSGISWIGPRHKKYKINFLKGYLLLHRKTWYEEKFNATMCNDDIYKEYRKKADMNFDDPLKKPKEFSFGSSSDELTPLYKESLTWGEFIEKMKEKYGEKKYIMMYDWYRQAIYEIFDGMEINQNWKIDLTKRPVVNCLELKGGKRRTVKKINFFKYNQIEPFIEDRSISY